MINRDRKPHPFMPRRCFNMIRKTGKKRDGEIISADKL
jgi:hypothetical protein